MKNIVKNYNLLFLGLILGGCELAGLDFQKDVHYDYHVLDPKVNMTAWEYMNSATETHLDSPFYWMLKGIAYAGIDQAEYEQSGRTYLFLWNDAILKKDSKGKVDANCFFGKVKGINGQLGTKWEDYSVETVRDLLLYHIIPDGVYSYDNLTPDNVLLNTLLPPDKAKPVLLKVINDRNSKIRVNDFYNTIKLVEVRSSNIQTTNGVVHVIPVYAEYGLK